MIPEWLFVPGLIAAFAAGIGVMQLISYIQAGGYGGHTDELATAVRAPDLIQRVAAEHTDARRPRWVEPAYGDYEPPQVILRRARMPDEPLQRRVLLHRIISGLREGDPPTQPLPAATLAAPDQPAAPRRC